MDRYEVMAGKMAPLTDGAHRKWGFTGKVETRSYERLVDALIDFVETGDSLKARFLTGFAACLAADRKSVESRGFGVAVRKVQCHRGEAAERHLATPRVPMHDVGVEVPLEGLEEGVTSWWMPPTTSDTSGRAGHTVRLPTRSRRLPCSDGSNNGS